MTGHSLGGAGVQEAIYSLIMMNNDFVAPSINITTPDPDLPPIRIARETVSAPIKAFMSNSFGFGGTNGSVIMKKV